MTFGHICYYTSGFLEPHQIIWITTRQLLKNTILRA